MPVLIENTFALLNETPDFSVSAELVIKPLAPLSIVTRMPGKYYRSDDAPTPQMLYGLLENALGWHVSREHRVKILKALAKRFNTAATGSNSGFQPLLQYHVQFGAIAIAPVTLRFSDYWGRLARTKGMESANGSREYSSELIPLKNEIALCTTLQKGLPRTKFDENGNVRRDTESLADFKRGDIISPSVANPYLPHYYPSPAQREYIETEPEEMFVARVETSVSLTALLAEHLQNPVAPLYLGNSDGWVEASWKQQ
jgi:CRISPR-associated protein Cas5